jgi:signal transduction histidine kinase
MIKPFDLKELNAKASILLRVRNSHQELKRINLHLEALVEARTRELVRKERQAIIGQLVQGMIHNLKSPLSVAKVQAQLTCSKAETLLSCAERAGNEPVCDLIEDVMLNQGRILNAIEKVDEIIQNLLEKSRHESCPRGEAIDLNALISRELIFLESNPRIKHDISKELVLDTNLPMVKGVYSDFSQVVYNLVQNAVDAMEESPQKRLRIETRFDDSHVYVDFADSGKGIAPEHRDHIFDSFFSTKNQNGDPNQNGSGGTGLGLFICAKLMEEYGGRFSVKSEPGNGAILTLILPYR